MSDHIVFFDGYCILCNGLVDFLLKADKKEMLKFASLQGDTAKKLLSPDYLDKVDTIIFKTQKGEISIKSRAIIQILITIGGIWKVFAVFSFLPSSFLNRIYDFVAQKRYKWFGKRDQCRIPNPNERERILP